MTNHPDLCTEPHCVYSWPHWHDENEDTHFLHTEDAAALDGWYVLGADGIRRSHPMRTAGNYDHITVAPGQEPVQLPDGTWKTYASPPVPRT